MHKSIVLKKHKLMLIPQHQCFGAKFAPHRYKMVSYQCRDYIMMEWKIETCRLLASIGLSIESPMREDYSWPGRFTPFEHQIVTSDFMIRNLRSYCFNDLGTGKSLSSLWAADYLMNRGEVNKVLICSTLSTLNRVWEAEIFHHFMHRDCAVLHGTTKKRLRLLAEDHDFYIINHEGIKVLLPELMARKDIDLIIADEGARFRNKKTGLWQSMNLIGQPEAGRKIWWMTGSPMPRAPTDAWGQAKIVTPDTVPKYFTRFRDQTMFKINMFKWVPRRGWEDIAYSSLMPSIRYDRDDCIDLPSCTYIDHIVAMSPDQVSAYNSLKEHFMAEVNQGLITASNEGVKIMKLLQVACGSVINDAGTNSYLTCTHKLKELEGVIDEVGTKLIIFVPFKSSINVITNWLDTHKTKYTYGIVNGDVGKSARDKIFTEFQEKDLDLIIAHPGAMAHGLTLTEANTICWWGPLDNFEIYEQANGRITRPGQTRKQYIKHLICSPVEKAVYARLKNKESMQGILLDLIKN